METIIFNLNTIYRHNTSTTVIEYVNVLNLNQ